MGEFSFGKEQEEEAREKIRQTLIAIRASLQTLKDRREAHETVCKHLRENPDLQKEFQDLWGKCGC